jgi:hypothetical protein
MFTRHSMMAFAVAAALGAPAVAGAQDFSFTYLEGGIIAGFVNDVEKSGTITGVGSPFELESDADGGGFIGGAWQVGQNVHLFGEYASASQELEIRGGGDTVSGDFDVVRWRMGIGYAQPVSDRTAFYGRLSFDSLELKNARVAGFNLDVDADDSGIGGEAGMIWAATPAIHLQGHVRYTSVGGVAAGGSDTFDSDVLIGLNGRWYFRPNIALVTGYEFGKITTWNVGMRFSF